MKLPQSGLGHSRGPLGGIWQTCPGRGSISEKDRHLSLSDSAWTLAFLGLGDAVGSPLSSRKLTSGPSGDSNIRVTAAQLQIFVAESLFKEKQGLGIFGGIISTFKY